MSNEDEINAKNKKKRTYDQHNEECIILENEDINNTEDQPENDEEQEIIEEMNNQIDDLTTLMISLEC